MMGLGGRVHKEFLSCRTSVLLWMVISSRSQLDISHVHKSVIADQSPSGQAILGRASLGWVHQRHWHHDWRCSYVPWSLYEDIFVEGLGCWIARDLQGLEFDSQWKHQMQWVSPMESVHTPKQESECCQIIEKPITNAMKICDKPERDHGEKSSTMSIAITIRFFGFRWTWSFSRWKGSHIYTSHVK